MVSWSCRTRRGTRALTLCLDSNLGVITSVSIRVLFSAEGIEVVHACYTGGAYRFTAKMLGPYPIL